MNIIPYKEIKKIEGGAKEFIDWIIEVSQKAFKSLKNHPTFMRFLTPPDESGALCLNGSFKGMPYLISIRGDVATLDNIACFMALAQLEDK